MKTLFTMVLAFVCLSASAQGVKHVAPDDFKLKESDSPLSAILIEGKKLDTVTVMGFDGGYWHVNYKGKTGYINEIFMPATPDIMAAKSDYNKRKGYKEQPQITYIKLGITSSDVERILGRPKDINRTVGTYGTHEQWVYQKEGEKMKLYYFEDGILTSWQD